MNSADESILRYEIKMILVKSSKSQMVDDFFEMIKGFKEENLQLKKNLRRLAEQNLTPPVFTKD